MPTPRTATAARLRAARPDSRVTLDDRVILALPLGTIRHYLGLAFDAAVRELAAETHTRRSIGQYKRRALDQVLRRANIRARRPLTALLLFVAAALLLLPPAVSAQPTAPPRSSTPTIDCAPLTTAQAQYWLDAGLCLTLPRDYVPAPASTALPAGTHVLDVDTWCRDVNAYAEPDRAALCVALTTPPPPALPVFEVGRVYVHPYPSQALRVSRVEQEGGAVKVSGHWVRHSDPDELGRAWSFYAGSLPMLPESQAPRTRP